MKYKSKYPEAFYRVSVKVVIRDNDKVLVVKEQIDAWTLPGGGIDHGESLGRVVARELYEEAAIIQRPGLHIIGTDSYYRSKEQDWIMWIVVEATFTGKLHYEVGRDCIAVDFIDHRLLIDSSHRSEQLVYKWCVDRLFVADRVLKVIN